MLGFNIVQLILAWYRLLFAQTAGTNRVYPRFYLAASLEMIILAIIATFIFTLHFDHDQVWEHPKFMILGAFNFCFGWYAARLSHGTHRPLALSPRVRGPSGTLPMATSSVSL